MILLTSLAQLSSKLLTDRMIHTNSTVIRKPLIWFSCQVPNAGANHDASKRKRTVALWSRIPKLHVELCDRQAGIDSVVITQ